jgi:hypothetical protein
VVAYRQAIAEVLVEAVHRALSPKVIQHAWKIGGLYPVNPAAVLDHLPELRDGTKEYFEKQSTTRPRIDSKFLSSEQVIAEFKRRTLTPESQQELDASAPAPVVDFDAIVHEAEEKHAKAAARLKAKSPAHLVPVIPCTTKKVTPQKTKRRSYSSIPTGDAVVLDGLVLQKEKRREQSDDEYDDAGTESNDSEALARAGRKRMCAGPVRAARQPTRK